MNAVLAIGRATALPWICLWLLSSGAPTAQTRLERIVERRDQAVPRLPTLGVRFRF